MKAVHLNKTIKLNEGFFPKVPKTEEKATTDKETTKKPTEHSIPKEDKKKVIEKKDKEEKEVKKEKEEEKVVKKSGKTWVNPSKKVVKKPDEEEKKVISKVVQKPKSGTVAPKAGVKKPVSSAGGAKVGGKGIKPAKIDSKIPKDLLQQLEETLIDKSKSNITFDSIKGQADIKQAVQENIILPLKNPKLFTGIRAPSRAILLYGPPGNGKTLLAKAWAHEIDRAFFSVSASSLMSKWVGEGEKLMKGLFTLAEERGPSIIFFDEVDSLLSKRKESENEASRRMKTEFLVQLDGVGSDTSGNILILAATNRPKDLDAAAMRRFTKRIFVGLPDFEARTAIVESLLSSEKWDLDEEEFKDIINALDGYSSSDLTYFWKDVAMAPLEDYTIKELECLDPDDIRAIAYSDFVNSMKKVRPSYGKEEYENQVLS